MRVCMSYEKLWEELKHQCLRLEDLSTLPLIDENTLENIRESKNINAEDLRTIGEFLRVDPFLLYEICEKDDPEEYHWKDAYEILQNPWIEMKITEDNKTVFFFKGREDRPVFVADTVLKEDFSIEDLKLAVNNNLNCPALLKRVHSSISEWYFSDPKICGEEMYKIYGTPWKK